MGSDYNKILIVDDDKKVRNVIVKILQNNGHSVLGLPTASECLAHCAKGNYLLIVDLLMPDTDGIELIGNLNKAGIQCPVIFMSGGDPQNLSTAKLLAKARGFDVKGCIEKPFRMENLLELL